MLRFIFLLMFLFVHMGAWSDAYAVEPLDFKGAHFGVSEQQFLEKHPEFKCSDAQGSLEIGLILIRFHNEINGAIIHDRILHRRLS